MVEEEVDLQKNEKVELVEEIVKEEILEEEAQILYSGGGKSGGVKRKVRVWIYVHVWTWTDGFKWKSKIKVFTRIIKKLVYPDKTQTILSRGKRRLKAIIPQPRPKELDFKISLVNPSKAPNKFVYSSDATGELEITLELTKKDGSSLADYKDDIRWSISKIGDSHDFFSGDVNIDWSDDWGVDSKRGEGHKVTVKFTGLPKNNSDFGNKTITAELVKGSAFGVGGKVTMTKSKTIQVFYPATASNSPSKASGTSDPNWFTYYKDAAGGGSYQYDGGSGRSESDWGAGESSIIIRSSGVFPYGTYITTKKINNFLKVTGVSKKNYYYRNFIGVLTHEKEHSSANQLKNNGGSIDIDGDRLRNNFEKNISFTKPDDAYSAIRGTVAESWENKLRFTDAEVYAGGPIEENAYKSASSNTDWASPGGQW